MKPQKTILVVDDNGSDRLMPGLILRPFGFKVIELVSAYEAMNFLAQNVVSHVLLNLQMPGLSGIALLYRIRADPRHKNTKLIAYTTDPSSIQIFDDAIQGFDAVLLKPIKSMSLIQLVMK